MDSRRRAVVVAGLTTAGLGVPLMRRARASTADSTPVALDDFLELSARLSGRLPSQLDRSMGGRILDALGRQGRLPALRRLADDPAGEPELAADVRAAWYSGQLPHGTERTMVGFQEALVWTSAPFLHVPGSCGGATGYWAQAPVPA